MTVTGPKRSVSRGIGRGLIYLVIVLGALSMVLPFVWMFFTSFKPADEIISIPPKFLPHVWTFSNYLRVFHDWPIGRFFLNSVVFSTVSTLSILFTSSIAGFVFAKYRFPGKSVLFMFLLATIMIPFQIYMTSFYLTTVSLHIVDTYLGLQLPYLIQSFGIFFMRQNIQSIPDDLLDAGRIDGASEFGIYARVVVPLEAGAIGALGIFAFISAWGYFIWPLIITNTQIKLVLAIGLELMNHQYYIDYGGSTASATIAVLPLIIVFLVLRRTIIEGVTLTGLKG